MVVKDLRHLLGFDTPFQDILAKLNEFFLKVDPDIIITDLTKENH